MQSQNEFTPVRLTSPKIQTPKSSKFKMKLDFSGKKDGKSFEKKNETNICDITNVEDELDINVDNNKIESKIDLDLEFKEVVEKDTCVKDSSLKDSSMKDSSLKDASLKDPSLKETSFDVSEFDSMFDETFMETLVSLLPYFYSLFIC